MEKEPKNWSEHPAYEEFDLEIKNEKELEKAKEMAGVTNRDGAIERHQQYEREASLGRIMQGYFDMRMALRKNDLSEAEKIMHKINRLGVPVINIKEYNKSDELVEKLNNDDRFIGFQCCSPNLCCQYFVLNPEFLRESDEIIKEYCQEYPKSTDFAMVHSH